MRIPISGVHVLNGVSHQAIETDGRQHQRDAGEHGEQHGVELRAGHGCGNHLVRGANAAQRNATADPMKFLLYRRGGH
jgi:hypothetical protein